MSLSLSLGVSLSVSISPSFSLIFSLSLCPSLSHTQTLSESLIVSFFFHSLSLSFIKHHCQRLFLSFPLSHRPTLSVPFIHFLSLFLSHTLIESRSLSCSLSLLHHIRSLSLTSVSLYLLLFKVSRFSYFCSTLTEQNTLSFIKHIIHKILFNHKLIRL